MDNIYEDIAHIDLGDQIIKLQEQNKQQLVHIHKLEDDVRKLCAALTDMKQVQQNLSKNISELFKTAKLEIQRKDRMIFELRQEVENMKCGTKTPFRYKRHLNEATNDDSSKRFKNDVHIENVECSVSNEEQSTQRERSTSIRSYGSDCDVRGNSRYSPSNSVNDGRRNGNARYKEKYRRRSNSRDRLLTNKNRKKYERSRSGTRYNGHRNSERYRSQESYRGRSNDRYRQSKSGTRRSNSRYSEERKRPLSKNTPKMKNINKRDLLNGRRMENELDKNDEILDLTNEILEEGEITADNYILFGKGEKIEQDSNITNSKSITIEEYRNKRNNLKNIDCEKKISNEIDQNRAVNKIQTTTESSSVMDANNGADINRDHKDSLNKLQNLNNRSKPYNNLKNSVTDVTKLTETCAVPSRSCLDGFENKHRECDEKPESNAAGISIDRVTENGRTVVESEISQIKNASKQAISDSFNDSSNTDTQLFNVNDSKGSNNCLLNSSESTCVSDTSINNSGRMRKRRCVVIGIKEKK